MVRNRQFTSLISDRMHRALGQSSSLETNTRLLRLLKELKIINGDTLPDGWGREVITHQLNAINLSEEELQEVYIESVMQKLIAELNDKEWQLRYYFFLLKKRIGMQRDQLKFYLPESLMLMNRAAHRKMREKLYGETVSADASGDGQSRESMAAFDMGDWRNVGFRSDFTAVKPNKKIGGNEYLHNLRALIHPRAPAKEILIRHRLKMN